MLRPEAWSDLGDAKIFGIAPLRETMALPLDIASSARDPRALIILAKTIYRELRTQGYTTNEVMTLAGELLDLVTSEVKDRRIEPGLLDTGVARADVTLEVPG